MFFSKWEYSKLVQAVPQGVFLGEPIFFLCVFNDVIMSFF